MFRCSRTRSAPPFRIYRDTRFSKDKSPYKSHLGASFPWVGDVAGIEAGGGHDERAHGNGGYFHFQPGEMYAGGGMWMMDKPAIEAFRNTLRDDPERVSDAIQEPAFVAWFGAAVRPRGAQADPARLSDGPPDGRDVPLEGRDVRSAAVGRGGLRARPADRLAEGYARAAPVFRLLSTLV